MKTSFVGIASPSGLELMVPESDHVIRFLMRRAYRSKRTGAVCFWAIMDEAIAITVTDLLHSGRPEHALLVIQMLAVETGSFCPDSSDWPVLSAG
ncbi:MAG: hypothetical protein ACYTGL_30390 [Planctomycetota bacterium]|jgi:hypothetical protein